MRELAAIAASLINYIRDVSYSRVLVWDRKYHCGTSFAFYELCL